MRISNVLLRAFYEERGAMKKILVDDCVEREMESCPTYIMMIDLLRERLSLQDSDVVTITRYNGLNRKEEKDDVLENLQVLCIHAASVGYTYLVKEAIENTIPVILFRGEKTDMAPWAGVLQAAGMTDLNPDQLVATGKLFYLVSETDDIRGAVRWITDYYYPLKKIAITRAKTIAITWLMNEERKTQRKFKEEMQRVAYDSE
jgi:hypothetical protein